MTNHPIKTITVNGLTGDEPAPNMYDERDAYQDWRIARFHNKLIGATRQFLPAEAALAEAEQAAKAAYEALSSASAWHAAHHRWVLAEDNLARAAADHDHAAQRFREQWREYELPDNWEAEATYKRHAREQGTATVPTNWPASDLADYARQVRADRARVAAQTLRALAPR